jgi:O-antigen ligase
MSSRQDKSQTLPAALPSVRLTALFVVATAGVAVAARLCEAADYRSALLVTSITLGAGFLVYAPVSIQAVLICWFAITPLASFYVRFPTDRSIITFNRVVFASLVFILLLDWKENSANGAKEATSRLSPFSMSKFEVAWTLLALLALASALTRAGNVAYAARLAFDTFVLPLVAFHIARNYLDLQRAGKQLSLACMALAILLFATGAFEFATGIDLFAFKGAELMREGERRVNGPFATDSSFAVICLMLFIFLQAAPRIFRLRLDRTGKLVYTSSLVAAALGALLPLFRAVAIALVVCWIFLKWPARERNRQSRSLAGNRSFLLGASAVILIALAGWFVTTAPAVTGSRLTDPRTAFGRLATWQAAAEITLDNPFFGAGLGNYAEYFDKTHYYSDEAPEEVLEARAVDSPHSNPLWISSELGLTGLALYIAANIYLLFMGWRAFRNAHDQRQRLTASCFLALIFAYWIPGMTLSSGYYSDLNLFFFFLIGALSSSFASSRKTNFPYARSMVSDFAD